MWKKTSVITTVAITDASFENSVETHIQCFDQVQHIFVSVCMRVCVCYVLKFSYYGLTKYHTERKGIF